VTTAALLGFAGLVAILGPRAIAGGWSPRAPRLAIFTWQLACVGVLSASVLAGLTLLAPATAVSEGLAAVLDACVTTIAAVYSSPGELPAILLGSLLAGLVPVRLALVAARSWVWARRERQRLRSSVLLGAYPEPLLGAVVIDSGRAAAFCVPGRPRTVVVTSTALDVLSDVELAGVLAHERAHLRGRHHLAVGMARAFDRAFPGVPLFSRATAEIERLIELLADDVAARRVDRVEVASALVTLAGMSAPTTTLAAAQGVGALRVTRLLRPENRLRPLPRMAGAAAGVVLVAVPVVLAAWPLLSAASSGLCVVPGAVWA
jgi:Zn-dependent protease with chaperone function